MADRREFSVGGKPISSLRVVDLKVELEKRSLPKSGSKRDLLERLRLVIFMASGSLLVSCFAFRLPIPYRLTLPPVAMEAVIKQTQMPSSSLQYNMDYML